MRAVIAAGALIALAGPTAAEVLPTTDRCGDRDRMAVDLAIRRGERQIGFGLAYGGGVIELWQAPGVRNWTIILTQPTGRACVIAGGLEWDDWPILRTPVDPGEDW